MDRKEDALRGHRLEAARSWAHQWRAAAVTFTQHYCRWPGCVRQVSTRIWGCRSHWYKLPLEHQRRILRAYMGGQETRGTASPEYIAADKAARSWAETTEARRKIQSADP